MSDLTIKSIKLVDITFLTIIYTTITILFSVYLDKLISYIDTTPNEHKSKARILIEIYINLTILAIASYIIRNVVELIPFPLDGMYSFEHRRVKELGGGIVTGFAIFLYQKNLRAKIDYLFK